MVGMTAKPLFTPENIVPSYKQIAIQTSREKSIIVDANAGSAKTTTLALKVAETLKWQMFLTGRYSPKGIMVLVYTDIAKLAFWRALEKLRVDAGLIGDIWVNTFDEFSTWVLQAQEGKRVDMKSLEDLKDAFNQCIEGAQKQVAKRPDPNLHLPGYEDSGMYEYFYKESIRIKGKMILPKAAWQEESVDASLSENCGEDYTILKLLQRFENLRRSSEYEPPLFRTKGDATYDLACKIGDPFSSTPQNNLKKWPRSLWLVCVDEFHDMNEAMFTVLRRLLESNHRATFCGVGDPSQVLHKKSGAEAKFMDRDYFASEMGRKTILLTLPGVYRFSMELSELVGNLTQKECISLGKNETVVNSVFYDAPIECAQEIAKEAKVWMDSKRAMNQFVVLLRHPHQSIQIENMLIEKQIPYETYPFPTYMHRPEVLCIRALLSVASPRFNLIQSKATRHRMIEALVEFAGVQLSFHESDDEANKVSQEQMLDIAIRDIIADQSLFSVFLKRQVIGKAEPNIRRRLEAAMKLAEGNDDDEMFGLMLQALDMPGLAAHRWVERERRTS
jgi:DNA helicase-2/ATP-dependent DNA helicase PcrA